MELNTPIEGISTFLKELRGRP